MQLVRLGAEVTALRGELAEALKLAELQKADLDRYEKALADARPHCPERTDDDQLQTGWARILDGLKKEDGEPEPDPTLTALTDMLPPGGASNDNGEEDKKPRRGGHGRRPLDTSNLPVKVIELDPPEVLAAGGVGYRLIGAETSNRVAYRYGGYLRLQLVRRKWVRDGALSAEQALSAERAGLPELSLPPVVVADLPACVWPRFMADPSAISNVIVSKYGDVLPLNRQESISARGGLPLRRSTLCNWLAEAYRVLYRVVDAMLDEARNQAFCIATDATGAPVKSPGGCDSWHVFVLVADRDHVIFRYSKRHTSAAVSAMLGGFNGHVLADASNVYDVLFRDGSMTESGCWSHCRRYFWKAVETERELAYEALSLISQLFAIERDCKEQTAAERKKQRRARAGPILNALDRWVAQKSDEVDPRGRLHKAINYYKNQRLALRQFLHDGRLAIHNNISERALRNLVLGRSNWLYFANETGLKWYTVFRSLIASCALHGLNPQLYLEQVLRLAPHWPVTRVIELAPKYWARTLQHLDSNQRAIITQPWEMESQLVQPTGSRHTAA